MSSVHTDPIREILNQTRGKDCSMVDLLIQSISLCIGFYFLGRRCHSELQSGVILQKTLKILLMNICGKQSQRQQHPFESFLRYVCWKIRFSNFSFTGHSLAKIKISCVVLSSD